MSDSDDDRGPKRRRVMGFDNSNHDPNHELEAMIAAMGTGPSAPSPSFSGVLGMTPGGGSGGHNQHGQAKASGKGVDYSKPSAGVTAEIFAQPKIATTPMDFSRMAQPADFKSVPVGRELVEYLMTPEHRQMLIEETGTEVEWAPDERAVNVRGSPDQVKKAQRLLQRVTTHCHWGRSQAKITRLLRPNIVESLILRLSPMNTLRPAEKVLNMGQTLSIGKDKANDLVIPDAVVSRQHCVLELDAERGAVYIVDCSTNGTYLNGRRLPSKQSGKVIISHGDEILLKDPSSGDSEYGYIVNINELHVQERQKLEAPKRILTQDEAHPFPLACA